MKASKLVKLNKETTIYTSLTETYGFKYPNLDRPQLTTSIVEVILNPDRVKYKLPVLPNWTAFLLNKKLYWIPTHFLGETICID